MVCSCGCDQEGRKLSWETGVKEVDFEFEVFPEATEGLFLIWKGEKCLIDL